MSPPRAPLTSIRIRGFRSAHDVTLAPGSVTALVGAPGSGTSNLLAAIWHVLTPHAAPLTRSDPTRAQPGGVSIEATFDGGATVRLDATPGRRASRAGTPPPALFLPAAARADRLVAEARLPTSVERALGHATAPPRALLPLLDAWIADGQTGTVVMIEEPELFLGPHDQRALYRLLRAFASGGNQVLYSTHEATFLNVARLEELALVERDAAGLTRIRRPAPLPPEDAFRALNEFDAERSELLLARAALLVEGMTEKLVFPFLFRAFGYDPDREGISIVECGGKPNIPIFADVCNRVGIPYLVVHDRDAAADEPPIDSEVAANAAIERVAGRARTVELVRDFEQVARLHGHRHKPERAWQWVAHAHGDDVPPELADVVRRVVALTRARR